MSFTPQLTQWQVQELLDEARKRYDYIMIDSPAGLGQGFQLATCGA